MTAFLRTAVDSAEAEDTTTIGDEHIGVAIPRARASSAGRTLRYVSSAARTVHRILRDCDGLGTAEVYERYYERTEDVVKRTVREYVKELCAADWRG